MKLDRCYTCLKFTVFTFDVLYWVLGCSITALGIWLRFDPSLKQYVDTSDSFNYVYPAAYLFIGIGALIVITGMLGCCGAVIESQCVLVNCFILLFVILVTLLATSVGTYVHLDSLKQSMTETLRNAIRKYQTDESARNFMNNIQKQFACCGADNGFGDYGTYTTAFKPTEFEICEPRHFRQPCNERLFAYLDDNMILATGVLVGIGVILLLGMVVTMLMCCTIRKFSQ